MTRSKLPSLISWPNFHGTAGVTIFGDRQNFRRNQRAHQGNSGRFPRQATAEKIAMGWHLDGRVSALVGTHTHVQTADEREIAKRDSLPDRRRLLRSARWDYRHGKKSVFRRMINQLPARFDIAEGPAQLCGVIFTIDTRTGKAVAVERISYSESSLETSVLGNQPLSAPKVKFRSKKNNDCLPPFAHSSLSMIGLFIALFQSGFSGRRDLISPVWDHATFPSFANQHL